VLLLAYCERFIRAFVTVQVEEAAVALCDVTAEVAAAALAFCAVCGMMKPYFSKIA
jgi:hypothetical protein